MKIDELAAKMDARLVRIEAKLEKAERKPLYTTDQ